MSNDSNFQFTKSNASERDVIDWITSMIYPQEYDSGGSFKSGAKKRVRSRIRYARITKKLDRPTTSGHIKTKPFFSWASRQKGWETLSIATGIQGTDINMNKTSTTANAIGDVGNIVAMALPDDPEQLKAKLIESEKLRVQAETERDKYKNKLSGNLERSRKAAKYGKEGGRGRCK